MNLVATGNNLSLFYLDPYDSAHSMSPLITHNSRRLRLVGEVNYSIKSLHESTMVQTKL